MSSSVAIITRTKNRPLFLRRALLSVLGQTYPHWSHVIVNDGGDPKEVEAIIASFKQEYAGRVQIIHHATSLGMEAASNAGIRASNSDYLLIHDDDDTLDPDFLKETVSYLNNTAWLTIRGVVTLTTRIDEHLTNCFIIEDKRTLFRSLNGCIRIDDMAKINPYAPISFLFSREVLNEIGFFDERLPVLGDWDFNLRFILKYDIGVISKKLANYHHRPQIKAGDIGNTVHAQPDLHNYYDTLVRNRYVRMIPSNALGLLLFQNRRHDDLLVRLYRHKVIGAFIRFWSKWVNQNIPSNLP